MNCTFCGKQLPQVSTGKRPREYCNNAHKQADYRRRHPTSPKTSESLRQLQEAQLRIRLLERIIRQSGLTLPTHIKRRDPVELWGFVGKHNVAQTPVQGVIEQKMLRPIAGEDGAMMLDAEGQCSFWQIFHDVGQWRTCPDCPHGEDLLTE
jgi:hypothetical protein